MPHHDSGTARDVERVFGAMLGNFNTHVAGIDHFLAHSLHLIAHHHRDFLAFSTANSSRLTLSCTCSMLHTM